MHPFHAGIDCNLCAEASLLIKFDERSLCGRQHRRFDWSSLDVNTIGTQIYSPTLIIIILGHFSFWPLITIKMNCLVIIDYSNLSWLSNHKCTPNYETCSGSNQWYYFAVPDLKRTGRANRPHCTKLNFSDVYYFICLFCEGEWMTEPGREKEQWLEKVKMYTKLAFAWSSVVYLLQMSIMDGRRKCLKFAKFLFYRSKNLLLFFVKHS